MSKLGAVLSLLAGPSEKERFARGCHCEAMTYEGIERSEMAPREIRVTFQKCKGLQSAK
jgi:hypothetical protein